MDNDISLRTTLQYVGMALWTLCQAFFVLLAVGLFAFTAVFALFVLIAWP